MSPALAAQSSGFSALLAAGGEPLTFLPGNSATSVPGISGVVDRTPDQEKLAKDAPKLDADRASVIEIFKSALASAPQNGDSFQDEEGMNHRVFKMKPVGFKYRCWCLTAATT